MVPPKLHELYAEKMLARHDYGWAFYEPPSSHVVRPGMVGYLDSQGLWNPIVDLCGDAKQFSSTGLTSPEVLPERAPRQTGIEWGPKYSEKVTGRRIDLSAGVDGLSLGLPVGVSCAFEISSSIDNGAVLLTEPAIWRDGFYHSHEFEVWVKQNSEALLKARPEIRERGLWVVKWTYSTKKCSINAWISKSKAVTVGFATNIVPVGEIGPKGEWSESNADGGWSHFTAQDDEDRKVVFMGGLFFRFRRLAASGKHLNTDSPGRPPWWTFRSAAKSATEEIDIDGEKYELSTEYVGRLEVPSGQEYEEPEEDVF